MSRLMKFTGLTMVMALLITLSPIKKTKAQPGVSVSFQMFYDNLQPYGQWIDNGDFGYCWVPNNVGPNFRPYYTNGRWCMTSYGNTWVSDYSWGWAPFHYGRWTFDDYYGWMWVPGTTWGPAWVSWRNGGGYYGWAPMAPGVSVNVAVGPRFTCSPNWWVFIPQRHIYTTGFQRYWRGPRYNTTIINRTTIINNTYIRGNRRYAAGPRRANVQRAIGRTVRTYGVRSGLRPGRSQLRGNTLNVYNPRVQQRQNNQRPQRVARANNVRTSRPTTTGVRRSQPTNNRATTTRPQRTATTNRQPRAVTQRRPVTQSRPVQNRTTTNRQPATAQRNPRATTQRRPTYNNQRSPQMRQQQNRITQNRQQAWTQNRQPTRQASVNRNRSANNRPTYNKTQANRNTQRARPQTRPTQSTRATQARPQTRYSNAQKSSSSRSSTYNRGSRSSTSRGRR